MRRLFGWVAGLVGIAALARVLARRSRSDAPVAASRTDADPAETLRRKLSETREVAPPEHEPVPPEPEQSAPRESLDERRARIHAKAQEAIDEMQGPTE